MFSVLAMRRFLGKVSNHSRCYFFLSIIPLSLFAIEPLPDSVSSLVNNPPTAFTLLGVDPSSIHRPSTPNDLSLYVMKITKDFTAIPQNFAIEVAPFWLWCGHKITYGSYVDSNNFCRQIFPQTWTVSLAGSFGSGNSQDSSMAIAIGTNFSFARGHVDKEFKAYSAKLDTLRANLSTYDRIMATKVNFLLGKDDYWKHLRAVCDTIKDTTLLRLFTNEKDSLEAGYEEKVKEELIQTSSLLGDIKTLSSSLVLRRIGWKGDFALAGAFESPPGEWSNLKLKAGGWITGGFEGKNWGAVAVLRAIYLNDPGDSSEWTEETGLKLFLDDSKKPFAFSVEGLGGFKEEDPFLKIVLQTEYRIGKNLIISLSGGKEIQSQRSNLIGSVKLLLGEGASIPLLNM